mmetsp:Transcript_5803/g.16303  ORF Transcript_5803/g.16303 Transcript_5803/m.16303 type:complete len:262 (+) Transcript_5803:944-1729(+)
MVKFILDQICDVLHRFARGREGVHSLAGLAHVDVAPVVKSRGCDLRKPNSGLVEQRASFVILHSGIQSLRALLPPLVVEVHVPVRTDAKVLPEEVGKVDEPVVQLKDLLSLIHGLDDLEAHRRDGGGALHCPPVHVGECLGHGSVDVIAGCHSDRIALLVLVLHSHVPCVGELLLDLVNELRVGGVVVEINHTGVVAIGALRGELGELLLLLPPSEPGLRGGAGALDGSWLHLTRHDVLQPLLGTLRVGRGVGCFVNSLHV